MGLLILFTGNRLTIGNANPNARNHTFAAGGFQMDVILGIFALLAIIAVLITVFSKSPQQAMQEAEDKLYEARQNLENARREQQEAEELHRAELDEQVSDISKNAHDARDTIIDSSETGFGSLKLDNLITDSLLQFGDIIETVKKSYPPQTRLIVCYMFIEALDSNISEETSFVGDFAKTFVERQMGVQAVEANDLNHEEFTTAPVFWANVLQSRIRSAYDSLDDPNDIPQICAQFTGEISASIAEEDIREEFCSIAREFLKEKGIYSSNAELAISGIEL